MYVLHFYACNMLKKSTITVYFFFPLKKVECIKTVNMLLSSVCARKFFEK